MLQVTINEQEKYDVVSEQDGLHVAGKTSIPDISMQPNGLVSVLHNNRSYEAIIDNVDVSKKEVTLRVNGRLYTAAIQEPIDLLLANMGLDLKAMQKMEPIKAPMPGLVLKILVEVGQEVNKGDGLIILEAMKMENVLKATGSAKVKAIKATEKTAVEKGTVLIELE